MNIDERFEKLERDNKRLKRYVAVSISIALAALIGGTVLGVHAASGTFHILTANTIYVKDNSGKKRAKLDRKGILRLYDSSGKRRVALDGTNGRLRLYDLSGKYRVALEGIKGNVKTYKSNGQVLHELGKGSNTSGPHTHPVAKHKHTATTTIR